MIGSTRRLTRLKTISVAALAASTFLVGQVPAPVAAAGPAAAAVVRAAESHLGVRYRRGATGPTAFDCSGLVYRSFAEAGLGRRIGGLHSSQALYRYFAARHLASRANPQVGDLVIWGRGSHVGIYVGHGRAISALTSGVRITRVSAVFPRFTTYLHTRLATIAAPTIHHRATASTRVRHVKTVTSLRGAAGTAHHRLAVLQRGARLTVIGSRRLSNHQLWLHVRTASGHAGWVAGWLVRA